MVSSSGYTTTTLWRSTILDPFCEDSSAEASGEVCVAVFHGNLKHNQQSGFCFPCSLKWTACSRRANEISLHFSCELLLVCHQHQALLCAVIWSQDGSFAPLRELTFFFFSFLTKCVAINTHRCSKSKNKQYKSDSCHCLQGRSWVHTLLSAQSCSCSQPALNCSAPLKLNNECSITQILSMYFVNPIGGLMVSKKYPAVDFSPRYNDYLMTNWPCLTTKVEWQWAQPLPRY